MLWGKTSRPAPRVSTLVPFILRLYFVAYCMSLSTIHKKQVSSRINTLNVLLVRPYLSFSVFLTSVNVVCVCFHHASHAPSQHTRTPRTCPLSDVLSFASQRLSTCPSLSSLCWCYMYLPPPSAPLYDVTYYYLYEITSYRSIYNKATVL